MRRTKQDSERTRQHIVDAARREFARRGVARTTMDHIARSAGVTRGAVYWHFANKQALFRVMRDQVSLPLVDCTDLALSDPADDPLAGVEQFLTGLLDAMTKDTKTRSTFDILHLKCEYVDEFAPELKRQTLKCRELHRKLKTAYERADAMGALAPGLDPSLAALDTCAFATGLMRLWLIDDHSTLIRRQARSLVAAHVATHRSTNARANTADATP